LLAQAVTERTLRTTDGAVIVAPDLGAVKLAREYARLLAVPMAVVHKVRTSGTDVSIERVAGEVRGRRPVIIDDMISTGGTIVAAARAVQGEGCEGELVVAATHAVLVPGALERLRAGGVRQLVVTDTLAPAPAESWVTVVSVAPLLADVVRRMFRM
jgi:ribose-phosphate pyrophosphokinase